MSADFNTQDDGGILSSNQFNSQIEPEVEEKPMTQPLLQRQSKNIQDSNNQSENVQSINRSLV